MTSHAIKALTLAKFIPLAEAEKKIELAVTQKKRNSLLYTLGENQHLIIYSFGVAVIFGVDEKESGRILRRISKLAKEPVTHPVTEIYEIQEDPNELENVEFNFVRVKKLDTARLLLIAEILAQSVAIEDIEDQVDDILDRFGRLNEALRRRGHLRVGTKEIMKIIGTNSYILQFVISKLAVLDKPDITWEEKDLESLFNALRKMFELEDRFRNLEFKLNYIQGNSELVLDVLQNKRAGRLELVIIALIVIEILLFVYDLFVLTKSV